MSGIEQAFQRLNEFVTVQRNSPQGLTLDSVLLLQESVGIENEARLAIAEQLRAIEGVPHPDSGQILYGLIVGLMAAQLEREARA
ncbi:MAG: hypothetical protein ACR2OC_08460 [Solirubrobacterales bacterium]